MSDSLIQKITGLITPELTRLGLNTQAVLAGDLAYRNLVWQWPGIVCDYPLKGLPLSGFVSVKSEVFDEAAFIQHILKASHDLRMDPHAAICPSGYIGLAKLLGLSTEACHLAFSTPSGFPDCIPHAGAILNLEAAEFLRNSVPIRTLVSNADEHYVITAKGHQVGVKRGLPILSRRLWDTGMESITQEVLRMPRGDPDDSCDYDLLARVRSLVWQHQEKVADFEAVDWLLQTLRVLARGKPLIGLQAGVQRLKGEPNKKKLSNLAKLQAYREAVYIMGLLSMSDKQKIASIQSSLVPQFMSQSVFSRFIANTYKPIPAYLKPSARNRILAHLQGCVDLEEEIYANET
jgi:hypothetical protein